MDGERNPEEVYRDFKETVLQLLTPKNQAVPHNQARVAAIIETPSLPTIGATPYQNKPAPQQPFSTPPTVFIIGKQNLSEMKVLLKVDFLQEDLAATKRLCAKER